jgi:hypothetical protein
VLRFSSRVIECQTIKCLMLFSRVSNANYDLQCYVSAQKISKDEFVLDMERKK